MGVAKREVQLLCRLLKRRFGRVPFHARARVDAASRDRLERWLDLASVANDLHEVFSGPG